MSLIWIEFPGYQHSCTISENHHQNCEKQVKLNKGTGLGKCMGMGKTMDMGWGNSQMDMGGDGEKFFLKKWGKGDMDMGGDKKFELLTPLAQGSFNVLKNISIDTRANLARMKILKNNL